LDANCRTATGERAREGLRRRRDEAKRPWTTTEDAILRSLAGRVSASQIARAIADRARSERTYQAVQSRARKLGITLWADLLSEAGAARLLRVSTYRVREWIASGALPARRIGVNGANGAETGGQWGIHRDNLARCAAEFPEIRVEKFRDPALAAVVSRMREAVAERVGKDLANYEVVADLHVAAATRRRRRALAAPNDRRSATWGPLHLDGPREEVTLRGARVRLTPLEYRIVASIMREAGAVVPYEDIAADAWGGVAAGDERHAIRVNMTRIRAKFGADGALFETAPSRGYRLAEPAEVIS